jgi:hypothetical protein
MKTSYPCIKSTEFNNFCDNDKYSDWKLSLGHENKNEIADLHSEIGLKWKKKVIEKISKKLQRGESNSNIKITDSKIKDSLQTLYKMNNGEPIIYKPYLYDKEENLVGIPDLLVRNDCIKEIFENLDKYDVIALSSQQSNFGNFYYIPVTLKFSSISLDENGKTMINLPKIKKYKIEIFTYCKILYKLQGILPKFSFIIGKSVIPYFNKNNAINDLDDVIKNPGLINFATQDNMIVKLFYEGIRWLRDVKTDGKTWKLSPMLYPNLKTRNNDVEKIKTAKEVFEITEIYYCNYWNRMIAFNQGIFNWNDKLLDANVLNIKDSEKDRVNGILKINRGEILDNNGNQLQYFPTKIKNNINNWKNELSDEMFVDFETVRNNLDLESEDEDEFIFLIGIYYKGNYECFIMDELTLESEKNCVKNFQKFWESKGKPRIFYWYAELKMWAKCEKRHCCLFKIDNWIDLYTIFYEEPFFVKGCKNFKLKSYIKALNDIGKIKVEIQPDECSDGLDAMLIAWKFYNKEESLIKTRSVSTNEVKRKLNNVIIYNKLDCIYLEVLLKFIRNL